MDAVAAPGGIPLEPGYISLSALSPGSRGVVVGIGSGAAPLTPLDRRLLEFGFCNGEQVEIIAETRPGRDPFVVRVGNTTLALRRCEAENIWVDTSAHVSGPPTPLPADGRRLAVDTSAHVSGPPTPLPADGRRLAVDTSAHVSGPPTPLPADVGPLAVEISRPGKAL